MLQDLKDSNNWSSKNTKIPRRSKFIQSYSKISKCVQQYVWFSWIYLGFKDFMISKIYQDATIVFPFFQTIEIGDCSGHIQKITIVIMIFARSNIDRQDFCWKVLIPYYQKSISCFLADIDHIFKIFKNCLHGYFSFSGAHLSNSFKQWIFEIVRYVKQQY